MEKLMQLSNTGQNIRPVYPEWHFLAEFSLSEFLTELDRSGGLAAGRLFQTVRQLGMPPEHVEAMEMTLAGFAKEAPVFFKEGRLELAGRIRVFCQKKIIESGPGVSGGWGYFMIERGKDLLPCSSTAPHSYLHLYLYKEGV